MGAFIPKKLRTDVWNPSSQDLIQELIELRRQKVGVRALKFLFCWRVGLLFAGVIKAGIGNSFRKFPFVAALFKLLGK